MSGGSHDIVGYCPKCNTAIPADHPYAWCAKCGTSLPDSVKAALGKTDREAAPKPSRDGVPLRVGDREVPCPLCLHTRFRTRTTIIESRAAAMWDMEWASPSAETYICLQCGHILWFMR